MTQDARTHGVDRHTLTWLKIDLLGGMPETGESFVPTPAGDIFGVRGTGIGGMIYTFMPNAQLGRIAYTCEPTSDVHDKLMRIHEADKNARNIVAPIVHTNVLTKRTITYLDARIINVPGESHGVDLSPRVWTFAYRKIAIVWGDQTRMITVPQASVRI